MGVWQEINKVLTVDNFMTIIRTISTISPINLIIMVTIPIIIIFLLLYSNRKRPQPWYLIMLALLTGLITVSTAFVLNLFVAEFIDIRLNANPTKLYTNLDAMFGVALVEEAVKVIFIILFIRKNKKSFAPYDGIVYGALIGLSFAIVENMMPRYSTEILRLLTSVPLHLSGGVIAGYFLAISTINKNPIQKKRQDYLAFFLPVLIHGIYNGLSVNSQYLITFYPNLRLLVTLAFILIILIIYVVIYIILSRTFKLTQVYYSNGVYPKHLKLFTVGEIFKKDLKTLVTSDYKYEDRDFIK